MERKSPRPENGLTILGADDQRAVVAKRCSGADARLICASVNACREALLRFTAVTVRKYPDGSHITYDVPEMAVALHHARALLARLDVTH